VADLKPLKPGQRLTAEWLNALVSLVKGAMFVVEPPMELIQVGAKWVLRLSQPQRFPARITGVSGSKYAWIRVVAGPNNTWADGDLSGTTASDPAYEFNGNANVPAGTRVEMLRQLDGSLRFQLAACDSTAQSAPVLAAPSTSASATNQQVARRRGLPPPLLMGRRRRPAHANASAGGGGFAGAGPSSP
jgi:hypothetical protein